MMKIVLVLATLTLILTASGASANPTCTPSDFCAKKIGVLIKQLNSQCFSQYHESSNQQQEADEAVQLRACLYDHSYAWLRGFGSSCGGPIAQEACLNKCAAYGGRIASYCLNLCSRF